MTFMCQHLGRCFKGAKLKEKWLHTLFANEPKDMQAVTVGLFEGTASHRLCLSLN